MRPVCRRGEARRVLDRLGAPVREEHPVEITGGDFRDEPRRFAAHFAGVLRADGAQPGGLVPDGSDDLRVLMADVRVDELRRKIKVTPPLVVPDV